MSRSLTCVLGIALATLPARTALAYCPCFTASSAYNDRGCAIESVPGTNPTVEEWSEIFAFTSRGPAVWGDTGPQIAPMRVGCDALVAPREVPARFPCELLKAIAMVESGWQHFCAPDRPADQRGQSSRTIISFDCGYGVAQVTSGMRDGETASFDRNRVASDPTYNAATGAGILAAKWAATRCVGDRNPAIIEHWYSATWAYNGLAYVNNPNNPNYDAGRGAWDPRIGGAAPYQERVFGWIEHTGGLWEPTLVAYPNPGEVGGDRAPPALPDPRCASPTDCVSTRPLHPTTCGDEAEGAGGMGAGGTGAAAAGAGGAPVADGSVSSAEAASDAASAGSGGGDAFTYSARGALHGSCSCGLAGAPGSGRSPWLVLSLGALAAARRRPSRHGGTSTRPARRSRLPRHGQDSGRRG